MGFAIGQSVGNPNVRNQWETDELFEQSSCVIAHDKDDLTNLTEGEVKLASQLLTLIGKKMELVTYYVS